MAKIFGKDKKWKKAQLTYKFKDIVTAKGITQAEVEAEFRKACDQWQVPSGLKFSKTDAAIADIYITCGHIDGKGKTAAMSGQPNGLDGSVTMLFDTLEEWTDNDAAWSAIKFLATSLHELGHAIGLAHSADPNAVMYPTQDRWMQKTALTEDDKDGAIYLYAGQDRGIAIFNTMDRYLSWFAFNDNDGVKLVALASGDLAPGEFKFYEPVQNGTGKYFIRFTHRGGGTNLAGGTVLKDSMISIFSVGSSGAQVQINN